MFTFVFICFVLLNEWMNGCDQAFFSLFKKLKKANFVFFCYRNFYLHYLFETDNNLRKKKEEKSEFEERYYFDFCF